MREKRRTELSRSRNSNFLRMRRGSANGIQDELLSSLYVLTESMSNTVCFAL